MERVAFLTPGNEPPLTCLLNPESLTQRRIAGVQQRRTASGPLTGAGLSDDPLLFTGGGRTELDLDLLFDVSLSESPVQGDDVRALTRRLWNLAENTEGDGERAQPQVVRFMWGKSWNIPGVVISVAERLEYFDAEGVPRRSWLRLRMLRVSEETAGEGTARPISAASSAAAEMPTVTQEGLAGASVHQTAGGTSEQEDVLLDIAADDVPLAAEDLVTQALAETSVGAQLDSAWGDLATAGRMIDELLTSLTGGAGAGEDGRASPDAGSSADEQTPADAVSSAETQELRAGMNEVQNAQALVADVPGSHLVESLTLAGATISAGLERMRAAAVVLLAQEPKEPEHSEEPGKPTLRQQLGAALQRVGAAERKVRDAATRAAAAIKAKAVVVIAAATQRMQGQAQHLDAFATRVSAAVSPAAAQAWETIRGVAAEIGQATRSVYEAGQVFVVEKLGPALGRLAAAANRLWLEGQVVAARGINRAVQGLSRAMQHVKAGAEAMASAALPTKAEALIEEAAERIHATLQTLSAGRERQATLAVRQDLAVVAAAAGTMAAAGAPPFEGPLAEQLNTARALVQEPSALAQPGIAQHVLEALTEIVRAAQALVAAEAEVDAQAVAAAASAAPAAAVDLVRATTGIGDRLDQLAYRYYRDPALWRLLATVNDIDHPLRVGAGSLLRIPPAFALRTSS